ncbi:N-acetylglucosamine-6-phosphate deacetylase [Nocardioides marmoraquaticus]
MSALLLSADRVLTGTGDLSPGWVEVSGGQVAALGEGTPPRPADLDLGAATVAPGLVDVHVHGGGGASFTGPPEEVEAAVATHRAAGTTTVLASLVTAAPDDLLRSVRELASLTDARAVGGTHLEGPWLSPRRAGAHEVAQLRAPDPAEVDALLEAGRGTIRMVTLAPELPGALDAVRRLVAAGVTVAVGHTDASYEETRAAIDAGASVGTHLFNTMPGLHHRDPGPVGALLGDDGVVVELVADGVHLHPQVLALAARSAAGRFALVSDAMAAAGAPDGDYRLGALDVEVRQGVARLSDSGAIAGSTLVLADAVRFSTQVAGLPLADAVRAATTTPAEAVGLAAGRLEPGAAADLVVLDRDLAVARVMAGGRFVETAG